MDPKPDSTDAIGVTLGAALAGRYNIGACIGHGATSYVYQARDVRHDREVAIKVLRPELSSALGTERFLREIRVAARLQHAHIVPLFDSGTAGALLYFVMPLLDGESLRQRLTRQGALPLDEALRLARQVADALAYANGHAVIHRDVKPANIFISGGHALLADFGLAQAVANEPAGDRITQSGLAVGTPEYMSPEQAFGEAAVDGRADVYSLGCVLYEMLAGEPPFRGRSSQAVLHRHLRETAPSLRNVRPSVPTELDAIVQRSLAKVPGDRYADASQFRQAIDAALIRVTAEHPRRLVPRVRLDRRTLVGAAVLGLGALAVLVWPRGSSPALDASRVMLLPLRDQGRVGDPEHEGEAVATYLGYALENTGPLHWLEGAASLATEHRANADRVPDGTARAIARISRAAHFIDGAIVRDRDSIRVVLRLHDVKGDSIVRRVGAAGPPGTSTAQLGIRAVAQLLPLLIEPGRRFDLTVFERRNPTAITHFLQGESEYRRTRYGNALAHYQRAVEQDSAFGLAALKGSLAARWMEQHTTESDLLRIAIANNQSLSPRYRDLALGLEHQHEGRADSAVAVLRRAIASDTASTEAWTLLGEVYMHLVPNEPSTDSLARDAFQRVLSLEPDLVVVLYHMVELDLVRGDTARLHRLARDRQSADDEPEAYRPVWLMSACLREQWPIATWTAHAATESNAVLIAGKMLSRHASHPRCAQGALQAVARNSMNPPALRWAALSTLFGLLVATGDTATQRGLVAYANSVDLPGWFLVLLRLTAEPQDDHVADSIVQRLLSHPDTLTPPRRWLIAEWAAIRHRPREVDESARQLRAVADSTHRSSDSVLAKLASALRPVARGDTAAAIAALSALRVEASYQDVVWQPWASLGGARLRLANMLLATGQAREAIRIAAHLDALEAAPYVLYYRGSLEIRERAARQLGDAALSRAFRVKLDAIRTAGLNP